VLGKKLAKQEKNGEGAELAEGDEGGVGEGEDWHGTITEDVREGEKRRKGKTTSSKSKDCRRGGQNRTERIEKKFSESSTRSWEGRKGQNFKGLGKEVSIKRKGHARKSAQKTIEQEGCRQLQGGKTHKVLYGGFGCRGGGRVRDNLGS